MTLVEILARELNEWPVDESLPLRQANDDSLYVSAQHTNGKDTNYLDIFVSKSENPLCDVTHAQWEAERARIASDEPNAEPESGQRTQYEQELWDKVAVAAMQSITSSFLENQDAFEDAKALVKCQCKSACEYADEFMAERAKRLKGVK